MFYDTEEGCKIWSKTNSLFQKLQEFVEFCSEHSKFSKICSLIGNFFEKYTSFDLERYRGGVIFHDTEKSWKIWKKPKLWFGKWNEEFGKFSSPHLKLWKMFSFSCNPFFKKMYELKIYRGVVMALMNDEKSDKGMHFSFQNWHKEFD